MRPRSRSVLHGMRHVSSTLRRCVCEFLEYSFFFVLLAPAKAERKKMGIQAKKRKKMNARQLREQQEKEKKWTHTPRVGVSRLDPVCGSLSALEIVRAVCPLQGLRVECYRLPCSHYVSRDDVHETVDAASYYGRPSVICPTCAASTPIETRCMACPGCRPFTFAHSCGFVMCASCVGDSCENCGEPLRE